MKLQRDLLLAIIAKYERSLLVMLPALFISSLSQMNFTESIEFAEYYF